MFREFDDLHRQRRILEQNVANQPNCRTSITNIAGFRVVQERGHVLVTVDTAAKSDNIAERCKSDRAIDFHDHKLQLIQHGLVQDRYLGKQFSQQGRASSVQLLNGLLGEGEQNAVVALPLRVFTLVALRSLSVQKLQRELDSLPEVLADKSNRHFIHFIRPAIRTNQTRNQQIVQLRSCLRFSFKPEDILDENRVEPALVRRFQPRSHHRRRFDPSSRRPRVRHPRQRDLLVRNLLFNLCGRWSLSRVAPKARILRPRVSPRPTGAAFILLGHSISDSFKPPDNVAADVFEREPGTKAVGQHFRFRKAEPAPCLLSWSFTRSRAAQSSRFRRAALRGALDDEFRGLRGAQSFQGREECPPDRVVVRVGRLEEEKQHDFDAHEHAVDFHAGRAGGDVGLRREGGFAERRGNVLKVLGEVLQNFAQGSDHGREDDGLLALPSSW
mmetsp:Transcript_24141/g.60101  ORF Transcript_24141/g.60101 Transcript_24141/m.60101 type:complete len:443 (-) Transcript_24141:308-1636(-)